MHLIKSNLKHDQSARGHRVILNIEQREYHTNERLSS